MKSVSFSKSPFNSASSLFVYCGHLFFFILILTNSISRLSASDPDLSLTQLRRSILGRYENDPARNERLAEKLEASGLIDEALFYYRRAAELQANSVTYQENLAVTFEKTGDYKNALKTYRRIMELDPKNERIGRKLALMLEESGNVESAETICRNLYDVLPDIYSRLNIATLLTEIALRHHRLPLLLESIPRSNHDRPDPLADALTAAQIYETAGNLQEAARILDKEKEREVVIGNDPDLFLLERLAVIAEKTKQTKSALSYRNEIFNLNPSSENERKLIELAEQVQNSFATKEQLWRSNPRLFLDELRSLLVSSDSREQTMRFAAEFLPEIPDELCTESFGGILALFRYSLTADTQDTKIAAELWHRFQDADLPLEKKEKIEEELCAALVGTDPALISLFLPDLKTLYKKNRERRLLQLGYWSSDGWESLQKTLFDAENDLPELLREIEQIDTKKESKTDIELLLRTKAALLFRMDKEDEGLRLTESFDFLHFPETRSLPADWFLFGEMEKAGNTQSVLANLYLERLSLIEGTPDHPFVLHLYRKAAVSSEDPELIENAVSPILEKMKENFLLAEKTDSSGNVTVTDPQTGENVTVNIYEIMNKLLDSALELKRLGLSKKAAELYHLYGEGKLWWEKQEGQGVFFFEELKTIIEESE